MTPAQRKIAFLLAALSLTAACDKRFSGAAQGPYASQVEEAIPSIEKVMGVKFKTQPKLEARSAAEVRAYLVKQFEESSAQKELAGTEVTFKLLGLIPDTMHLKPFILDLLQEQVAGYYDPQTKVLYVVEGRGADDMMINTTITHELVHALQDQYMNLDSLQKAGDGYSDRQSAAQAVIEGQATFEQMNIVTQGNIAAKIPGGWDRVRELIRENSTAMPRFSNAPMAIQESLLFPYLSGAEFMKRWHDLRPGKLPFGEMPTSTEQVLHEKAFFGATKDLPLHIELPAAQGKVLYENEMGEFGTRLFLYQHLKDVNSSSLAAMGWGGDRIRVLAGAGGNSLAWVSGWDTAVDAAEFVDALGRVTSKRYGVTMADEANGARTYRSSTRTVSITQKEINGRNVVLYVDVPAGASTAILDISSVKISQ
ncbi:MAG: hypothetical protein JWO05_3421 [Gemmatimonadetes bacterium]|nr:hypothetical protein [Gemmatimonadota bacterium]